MQQHRGRLILARSDEVYLFNRVPTFCKHVSVRGIRSIVLHLFDTTTSTTNPLRTLRDRAKLYART